MSISCKQHCSNKSFLSARPLKNAQFCSSSRITKILTAGIHLVFRGLKSEFDAEIGQKRVVFKGLLAFCLAIVLLCALAYEGHAKNLIVDQHRGVIVIDPGHGGYDRGAKGPEGTLEKTVTLKLARIIAVALSDTYKVVFTRTDDYWLDIPSRPAVANHESADLFISLHIGGSFQHKAGGISLYYFKENTGPALSHEDQSPTASRNTTSQIPWGKIQARHKTTSSVLAELMRKRINEQAIFIGSKVQGAPLMVLEGADMPAVVIEIGYITNPSEENSLRDINVLSRIAKGVRSAVDDYFKKIQ